MTTTDTVYTGFGFEAITGAATRTAFTRAVLTHLGAARKLLFDAPAPRTRPRIPPRKRRPASRPVPRTPVKGRPRHRGHAS